MVNILDKYKGLQWEPKWPPPPYTILFVDRLERQILSRELKPYIWLRFIDDMFIVWLHGDEELDNFLCWTTSMTPSGYHMRSQIGNRCASDIYRCTFLLEYHSCHPSHTVSSLMYSQALRFHRICSTDTFREWRLNDLKEQLLNRDYPEGLIITSIEKALQVYRKNTKELKKSPIPLILTFDPAFPDWNKGLMRQPGHTVNWWAGQRSAQGIQFNGYIQKTAKHDGHAWQWRSEEQEAYLSGMPLLQQALFNM